MPGCRQLLRASWILFCVAMVFPVAGPAQDLPDSSALRVTVEEQKIAPEYTVGEVVITATRSPRSLNSLPSSATLLAASEIAARPGSQLSSALSGVGGLVIRSYGAGSSVQTVSLRGMAPEHTLLLVDGRRYNTFQNGLSDFGILSLSDVERIEVVKGGYSSLYGSDAIGGVINVVTKRPSAGFGGALSTSLGSGGFLGHELSLHGSVDPFLWGASIRRDRGRGDYKYRFNDGRSSVTLRRRGEDFSVLTFDTKLEYVHADELKGNLALSYIDADRGSPGIVTDPYTSGKARLGDRNLRTNLALDWIIQPGLSARLNSSFLYWHETFSDPQLLIAGNPLNSYYTNRSLLVSPELNLDLSPEATGTIGVEVIRGWIASNEVNDALRWQRSAYISTQHSFRLPMSVPFEVVLYPALRYDGYSDVKGDISPRLGVNLGLVENPELRLRASLGKSFRAPMFNDLYWASGGNPTLKPERSISFDCGIASLLPFAGLVRLEANYFSIRTSDRIIWMPATGSLWSPRNVSRVRSRGVEVSGRWTGMDGVITLDVNSTWMRVTKRSSDFPGDPTEGKDLIYQPRQTVNAAITVTYRPFAVAVHHAWVSYRYTTEMNDRYLPNYSVTSATARYALQAGPVMLTVKLEATNLFNSSYQVIAFYPMPLRQFRATLGAEL